MVQKDLQADKHSSRRKALRRSVRGTLEGVSSEVPGTHSLSGKGRPTSTEEPLPSNAARYIESTGTHNGVTTPDTAAENSNAAATEIFVAFAALAASEANPDLAGSNGHLTATPAPSSNRYYQDRHQDRNQAPDVVTPSESEAAAPPVTETQTSNQAAATRIIVPYFHHCPKIEGMQLASSPNPWMLLGFSQAAVAEARMLAPYLL